MTSSLPVQNNLDPLRAIHHKIFLNKNKNKNMNIGMACHATTYVFIYMQMILKT